MIPLLFQLGPEERYQPQNEQILQQEHQYFSIEEAFPEKNEGGTKTCRSPRETETHLQKSSRFDEKRNTFIFLADNKADWLIGARVTESAGVEREGFGENLICEYFGPTCPLRNRVNSIILAGSLK